MATVSWVVFKHHKKADGTYNPKIRITHNGTSSYIATPIFTELVRFKKGSASGTVTSEALKDSLNDSVKKFREMINENQELISNCNSSKDIVSFINRKQKSKEIDFIEFARKDIAKMKNTGSQSVKATGINSLCYFLKESTGVERLNIKNLTASFLRKYEAWLRSDRILTVERVNCLKKESYALRRPGLNNTGIRSYMSTIQSIFNNALIEYNDYEIGDVVITNNPFMVYRKPKILEAKKRAVDASVIRMIYEFQPDGVKKRTMEIAKDVYMLSFLLAGMNIVDMFNFQIVDGRVEYNRQKTKDRRIDQAFISVGIHPLAQEIIDRYRDPLGESVLDFRHRYSGINKLTSGVNYGLKNLCEALDIEYIQFYSARHSFATIARNDCNVSKDDIALCLNHSSGHNITDTYIKQDFSRIDDVINKVVQFVFGEKKEAGE